MALPAVVVVLLLVLGIGAASGAQLRAIDAARAGARVAALGDDDAAVRAVAERLAGSGARISVVRDPPWVTVNIDADAVAGLRVGAAATAWVEP